MLFVVLRIAIQGVFFSFWLFIGEAPAYKQALGRLKDIATSITN